MSNSKLAKYRKISPNRNSPRKGKILGIAPHCYVGQVSVNGALNNARFNNYDIQNGASCNYIICTDGSIVLIVPESDRSWCTSSNLDENLVTIECACDSFHPYKINDKVKASLINLMADICYRNGIKKLLWSNNKSLMGKWNEQNIVLHRWTKNKACPGDYIVSILPDIVKEVNLQIEALRLNDNCPYEVKTTVDGVRLYDKLGGTVVKKYTKGYKLNVSEVRVYKGELFGKGLKTKKWFRLKNTKKV